MRMSTRPGAARRLKAALGQLVPGHFAVVMATGILSIDAALAGRGPVSLALLVVAATVYLGLLVVVVARLARRPARLGMLPEPVAGFETLTFVAGSGVLGSRLALAGWPLLPRLLWLLAVVAWAPLTYRLAAALTVLPWRRIAPTVRGTWLLAVVAVQALVGLGVHLGGPVPAPLAFACACGWLLGLSLYAAIALLLSARLLARPLRAAAITPDYWICMGALAISTLAGSQLLTAPGSALSPLVRPFVAGLTVTAWAVGTAWIPWLIGIELWRQRRDPGARRYERGRWSTVFPLGMYGACSLQLAPLVHVPGLALLGHAFFWLGLACWVVVAAGAAGAALGASRESGHRGPGSASAATGRPSISTGGSGEE
jgi:tellurite resistance protein TehA-like permease